MPYDVEQVIAFLDNQYKNRREGVTVSIIGLSAILTCEGDSAIIDFDITGASVRAVLANVVRTITLVWPTDSHGIPLYYRTAGVIEELTNLMTAMFEDTHLKLPVPPNARIEVFPV